MDYELELEIWLQARRSVSAHAFVQMVTEAVESYQRMPGTHCLKGDTSATSGCLALRY